jgi:Haem-binding domain
MKKFFKWFAIGVAVAFLAIQVYRPARTNPPVDPARTLQATMPVPPHIDKILARSCNDCHSNNTKWPWYSNIAPLSWKVIEHVNEGREHLNFSNWAAYPPDDAEHAVEEMCEETEKGNMPIPDYLYLHPEAKLSKADVRALCDWTDQFDGGKGRGRNRGRGSG